MSEDKLSVLEITMAKSPSTSSSSQILLKLNLCRFIRRGGGKDEKRETLER